MSARRSARGGAAAADADTVPVEFYDETGPFWRDPVAIKARFPEYYTAAVESRLRMGGRVAQHLIGRWCLDHGFESTEWPKCVDWRALRVAMGREA